MLQRLNMHAAECLAHAAAMEQRAREILDPEVKAELFDTARRWRGLAESYQFVDRIEDFLNAHPAKRKRDNARRK